MVSIYVLSSDFDQGSKPNSATPVCVPTNTFPFTITGVMNLFPLPNCIAPTRRLVAVVKLPAQVGRIVGMQHTCVRRK